MSRQKKLYLATTTALIFGFGLLCSDMGAQAAPKDLIVPELKGSPEDLRKLKEIMPPRPQVKDDIVLPRYPDPHAKKQTAKRKKAKKKPRELKIDGGQSYSYQKPRPKKPQRLWHSRATTGSVYVFERKARPSYMQPPAHRSYKQQVLSPTLTKPHTYSQGHVTKICYMKVQTPAKYKTVTKRVLVRPEKVHKHFIPAQYRNVERRVLVRPEKVKIRHHKARYGYVLERVLVKPERVHVRTHPAKVRYVNERVLVSPPQQRVHVSPPQYGIINQRVQVAPARDYWTVQGYAGRCGVNPVYCRVQTPPQYIDQARRVLIKPGQRYVENIPARYRNVRRQVVVKPAYNQRIVSPAVYRTIKRKVVLSPAWEEKIIRPAKYRIVRESVLVHPERTQISREPAIYKTITKNVLVERGKTHYQRVHVKKGGC